MPCRSALEDMVMMLRLLLIAVCLLLSLETFKSTALNPQMIFYDLRAQSLRYDEQPVEKDTGDLILHATDSLGDRVCTTH